MGEYKFTKSSDSLYNHKGLESLKKERLEKRYGLDGRAILDILGEYREFAHVLKDQLPPDRACDFVSLLEEENFSDSPRYLPLAERINLIGEQNQRATETLCQQIQPLVVDNIMAECQKYNVNNLDDITSRLSKVKVIALDLYRFFAFSAKYRATLEGLDVPASFVAEDDVILLSTREPENEPLRSMIVSKELNRFAYMTSLLTHEMLHAASFLNYWVVGEKVEGKDSLLLVKHGPQRVGLSINGPLEGRRLNWLNEGLTQRLTQIVMPQFADLDEDVAMVLKRYEELVYFEEQEVLRHLCEAIPEELFIKAYFEKEALLELNKTCKRELGYTLAELDDMAENGNNLENLKKVLGFSDKD